MPTAEEVLAVAGPPATEYAPDHPPVCLLSWPMTSTFRDAQPVKLAVAEDVEVAEEKEETRHVLRIPSVHCAITNRELIREPMLIQPYFNANLIHHAHALMLKPFHS